MNPHLPPDIDAFVLLEIAEEILRFGVGDRKIRSDGIQDLGVFLPTDGHHGGEIIVAILLGEVISLAHSFAVTNPASIPSFGGGGKGLKILVIGFVVIRRDDEFHLIAKIALEIRQEFLQFLEAPKVFFRRIDVGIIEVNRDVEMRAKESEGKTRAGPAASVQQKTRTFSFWKGLQLFKALLEIIHVILWHLILEIVGIIVFPVDEHGIAETEETILVVNGGLVTA